MGELYKIRKQPGRKQMLGKILLNGEFVSSEDLGEALQLQKKLGAQLGQILTGMGVLDEAELEVILSVQEEFATPEDAIKAAAGMHELMGELLIRVKRLKPESLKEALAEQNRTGEKLGDILVRRGMITASELKTVLDFHRRQDSGRKNRSTLRLGEILVRSRMISRKKIEEALQRQKLSDKKIGDILITDGYLKPEQLAWGLRLQKKLVTAALAAALSFASVLPAAAFNLPPSRSEAKMQIAVEAIVKARIDEKTSRYINDIGTSNANITQERNDLPEDSYAILASR
jgi:chitinase